MESGCTDIIFALSAFQPKKLQIYFPFLFNLRNMEPPTVIISSLKFPRTVKFQLVCSSAIVRLTSLITGPRSISVFFQTQGRNIVTSGQAVHVFVALFLFYFFQFFSGTAEEIMGV